MLIGDQIKLRIELEKKEDIRVQFPAWGGDQLSPKIEIVTVYPVDSVPALGMMRYTQDLLITSFDSGRHELPAIRFPFVDSDRTDTIATTPIFLNVLTMPTDTMQHIADIKTIYQLPVGWADIRPWLLLIGAILLGIALIGLVVYMLVRWKNDKPIFGTPKPVEPPHITALRELDLLRNEKLWQNNRTKIYYTRLSDIVRTYIEGRFGVAAMEMTSDEILHGLQHFGFEDNNLVNRLNKLLRLSDLVKFAKMEPLPDENETAMLDSYLFVNNTKIEEAPVETDEKQTVSKEFNQLKHENQ
jgi:hypothetical protein